MSKVKLGIIGCGVIGQRHLHGAAADDGIELTAIADQREDVRNTTAEAYPGVKTFREGDELIDDDHVEAVVLALPTCGRFDLAMHAFDRGKHVLTEKPVAMNVDEVRKLIDARGDLTAACCSSRFHAYPSIQAARELFASGKLGKLREVFFRCFGAAGAQPEKARPIWRLRRDLNGGGIMCNWGVYDLDTLLGIIGWSLTPKTVFAKWWTIPETIASHIDPSSDAETHFTALIGCEDGTMLHVERGEYMPIRGESAWQIIGEKGALRLNMTGASGELVWHDELNADAGVKSHVVYEGEFEGAIQHNFPVQDFAAAIRDRREPTTTLEKALIVQQINDAIIASGRKGEPVEVS